MGYFASLSYELEPPYGVSTPSISVFLNESYSREVLAPHRRVELVRRDRDRLERVLDFLVLVGLDIGQQERDAGHGDQADKESQGDPQPGEAAPFLGFRRCHKRFLRMMFVVG